jgi:hypothetical protein
MANSRPGQRIAAAGAAAALALLLLTGLDVTDAGAQTTERPLTVKPTDDSEHGDGTMGAAATAAMLHGPLPASQADIDAKAAANAAAADAAKKRKSTGSLAPALGGPPAVNSP